LAGFLHIQKNIKNVRALNGDGREAYTMHRIQCNSLGVLPFQIVLLYLTDCEPLPFPGV
jgi:hypothetical protein